MIKKLLKIIILIVGIFALMSILHISIFVKDTKIDSAYFKDKIKNIPYAELWDTTKEKAGKVKEIFLGDKDKKNAEDNKDKEKNKNSNDNILEEDSAKNSDK